MVYTVYDKLEMIASTSSRNEKEKLLKEYGDDLFKRVLSLAYDPMINFYLKKIPDYTPADDPTYVAYTLHMALDELNVLSSRELTGNEAIRYFKNVLEGVDPKDAIVLERVVLKDLRCGISDSTINKVWKGFIPETPYMRCSLLKDMKKPKWMHGYMSQTKADGSFTYMYHNEDSTVEFTTRNGRQYDTDAPHFNKIVNHIKSRVPKGKQLHGEMLVREDGKILPRHTGNGILNSVLKGGTIAENQEIIIQVWDIIDIKNFKPKGSHNEPYAQRYVLLDKLLYDLDEIQVIDTTWVYSMEEALADYKDKLSKGLEGTILKDPLSIWEDKTSKLMWKFKLEVTVDLMIVAFTEGKGKNANTFGSMTCVTADGLLEVNVSGLSDEERLHIHNNRESYLNKISAVTSNALMEPKKEGGMYSLFLPRCAEIREDKTEADTLEQVKAQFESVIKV